ncbi:hypothetical protein GF340_02570 [Candidatus Peregrinibacteria bacterium]|nr:hypothetical protein [Candidatus Peregrinibacteria bacterium]
MEGKLFKTSPFDKATVLADDDSHEAFAMEKPTKVVGAPEMSNDETARGIIGMNEFRLRTVAQTLQKINATKLGCLLNNYILSQDELPRILEVYKRIDALRYVLLEKLGDLKKEEERSEELLDSAKVAELRAVLSEVIEGLGLDDEKKENKSLSASLIPVSQKLAALSDEDWEEYARKYPNQDYSIAFQIRGYVKEVVDALKNSIEFIIGFTRDRMREMDGHASVVELHVAEDELLNGVSSADTVRLYENIVNALNAIGDRSLLFVELVCLRDTDAFLSSVSGEEFFDCYWDLREKRIYYQHMLKAANEPDNAGIIKRMYATEKAMEAVLKRRYQVEGLMERIAEGKDSIKQHFLKD